MRFDVKVDVLSVFDKKELKQLGFSVTGALEILKLKDSLMMS
jgi:hypothetical protein